ncbi:hypothetical protein CPB85DRAFT_1255118 [Mucidula mucida]|nr:hypothetical protein CPB85DRAFT_1255118 [Mucidula mucida]
MTREIFGAVPKAGRERGGDKRVKLGDPVHTLIQRKSVTGRSQMKSLDLAVRKSMSSSPVPTPSSDNQRRMVAASDLRTALGNLKLRWMMIRRLAGALGRISKGGIGLVKDIMSLDGKWPGPVDAGHDGALKAKRAVQTVADIKAHGKHDEEGRPT